MKCDFDCDNCKFKDCIAEESDCLKQYTIENKSAEKKISKEEKARIWKLKNKDKLQDYFKDYYQNHKEQMKAYSREYYRKKKERMNDEM